ncbi:Multicopper oxidase [Tenacibaculum sp. MAR_2009_124]|uniref:multicopper oxidase domain-containing protein n=1 Tax=Tenacibaculum sp. MAR_2009_124 TaxID=1250059 RepID=UPI0008956A31|nr:multicopper oxidase domain-containing protein [Tenacibaculum sp. MAR_2009_124]SED14128.1 Multicopper oxidase [Tenacibaculum sp. MAR_2009_124]
MLNLIKFITSPSLKILINLTTTLLLLSSNYSFSQEELLLIGRTTGKLSIAKNKQVRVFGFSKSLSGEITLPGAKIETEKNKKVKIDFWNISQGNPVSLFCKDIIFEQFNKKGKVIQTIPIDHMEHGYYSFTPNKEGTFLYYSPENYPFNLQAGMFGVIIVKSENNKSLIKENIVEKLFCSHEIDKYWHANELMDVDHSQLNNPITPPPYKPKTFLINGKKINSLKGIQSYEKKKNPVLLRLVNAGLCKHEILFPNNVNIQFISGKEKAYREEKKHKKIELYTGDSIDLLVSLEEVSKRQKIIYQFIKNDSEKTIYKASIPIFIHL